MGEVGPLSPWGEGWGEGVLHRILSSLQNPLIRPSGTFSPRGEGYNRNV